MSSNQGGAKVGVRIAGLVSQSIVHTQTKLLGIKHKLAMSIFHAISDTISDEVHQTLDPVFKELHSKYGMDKPASQLLDFMANGKGQLHALAGASLSQTGLLWPISAVINNELAPVVYEGVATNPHSIPDAGTIAQMAAQAWIDDPSYLDGMAKNGINSSWAAALKQTAQQYPDYSVGLELVRRGELSTDTCMEWLIHGGVPAQVAEYLIKLVGNELSPADAALAVLRGNMTQGQGEQVAAANGLTAEQFQTLVDNTGEPLGLMELLEARRRDFIDDDRLTRGIIQSRVRNEWVDVAKAIAFSPMSTADAVNAVVQNHLTQAQASVIASQNGLEAGAFDTLVQTAGEPLSRTEMEQLYNRGLATEDDVKQALAESRLKNKYSELAFELHVKLLPITALAEAVQLGTMTQEAAVAEAMKNGYGQADATTLVTSAAARRLLKYREEIISSAETMYIDNAMTLDDAEAVVTGMGHSQQEADAIFRGAEYKRVAKITLAAQNAIRSKYLTRHITSDEASTALDSLGTPSANRDQLLALWSIEQSANVKQFTAAEIVKYDKAGRLAPGEGLERLEGLGWNKDDATILLGGDSLQKQLSQGTGGLELPSPTQ